MGNKRERHQAKLAKRATVAQNSPTVLMPKAQIGTNLIPVLKPAFKRRNEDGQGSVILFYGSLTALRVGHGNGENFQMVYSRLAFGRIMAMEYFTDEVAEEIHYAIGNMIIQLESQPEGNRMALGDKLCDEIHECFKMIDDMAGKVEPHEFDLCGIKLINMLGEEGTVTEYNMIEWDDFKARESKKNQIAALVADRRFK
jgi:hypothetical protein